VGRQEEGEVDDGCCEEEEEYSYSSGQGQGCDPYRLQEEEHRQETSGYYCYYY